MNPIDQCFQRLREKKRRAFIPFLTTGDPDIKATLAAAEALVEVGADILEIGFHFSDAIADGPVIQSSYARALDHGLRVDDVFDCIRQLSASKVIQSRSVPLVGMVSYSLVHRRGVEKFFTEAKAAGLSGAIVPDLPFEESASLRRLTSEMDLKLIHLVTPTTPREQAVQIAQGSTGFLYCVSITGITGERSTIPPELSEQLTWLRQQTELPLCVGFGISKPEHVELLRDHADGIIVGSAFVRRLEQVAGSSLEVAIREIRDLAGSLIDTLNNRR